MSWDLPIYRIQPVLKIFFFGRERPVLGAGAVHQLALHPASRVTSLVGPTLGRPGFTLEGHGTPGGPGCSPRRRGAPRGGLLRTRRARPSPGVTWVNPGRQLGSGRELP